MGVEVAIAALAVNLWQGEEQKRAQQSAMNEQRAAAEANRASQEKQFKIQQQQAEVQNVRSVRQQIRQARMRQASMVNTAALKGGLGGSALAGAVSSTQGQTMGNLDFMASQAAANTALGQEQLAGARVVGAHEASAMGYMSQAQTAASYGNLAGTIFQASGGWGSVVGGAKSIFGPKVDASSYGSWDVPGNT